MLLSFLQQMPMPQYLNLRSRAAHGLSHLIDPSKRSLYCGSFIARMRQEIRDCLYYLVDTALGLTCHSVQ